MLDISCLFKIQGAQLLSPIIAGGRTISQVEHVSMLLPDIVKARRTPSQILTFAIKHVPTRVS